MLKKILIVTLLTTLLNSSAQAEMLGWYAILEVGNTRDDYTVVNEGLVLYQNSIILGSALPSTKNTNTQGVKVDVGYTFNDYLAAELGFGKYGKTQFDNIFGIPGARANLSLSSLDLLGVVKFPIDKFRLDAKLGVAWAVTKGTFNPTATTFVVPGQGTIVLPTLQQRKIRLTYAVEAAYDFTEVFGVALAWQRIPGSSGGFGSSSGIQTTDFASIGLVYHFDEYLR